MSRGNLLVVTVLLCCITAFISAWLDNVTTMLLMAPMTMSVFEAVGRNPVPLLLAQVGCLRASHIYRGVHGGGVIGKLHSGIPYVLLSHVQAMLSNIGGTATLIGDPPNIIIGLKLDDYIGFIDFMSNLVPGVVAAVPACIYVMVLLYPKDMKGAHWIHSGC